MATSALDRLYQIDNPEALEECLNAFLTAVKGSFETLSKKDEDALIAAVTTGDKPISPELYARYADNFRRAVNAVPINDTDLSVRWQANVSRFAAYKAYHATKELRRLADEEDGDLAILRATLHKYNRYQAAEYNTAVARARTGKQWLQFDEPDNRRLFPCIKWLPSRSATPREEHMPFYNRIWPKDDPFWTYNQPGTLWNCKCDWEQTDEDPTDGNPDRRIVKPGLDQNPATSGQIFTDTAAYIKKAPADVPELVTKMERALFREEHKAERLEFSTPIGDIQCDKITFQEVSKGASDDKAYFLKLYISTNIDSFVGKLKLIDPHEKITPHNTKNSKFGERKAKFKHMIVYELSIQGYTFTVKFGEYKKSGKLNLYSITG